MPTPAERSALLFVAAVAALGIGVRGCRAVGGGAEPPLADREALALQIAAVDSVIASGGRRGKSPTPRPARPAAPPAPRPSVGPAARAEPASPASPIDVNRATAEDLDRLPGIGPALAARIIAHRDSVGAFQSLDGLQSVKGIGPALAAKLAPRITFSGQLPGRPP